MSVWGPPPLVYHTMVTICQTQEPSNTCLIFFPAFLLFSTLEQDSLCESISFWEVQIDFYTYMECEHSFSSSFWAQLDRKWDQSITMVDTQSCMMHCWDLGGVYIDFPVSLCNLQLSMTSLSVWIRRDVNVHPRRAIISAFVEMLSFWDWRVHPLL